MKHLPRSQAFVSALCTLAVPLAPQEVCAATFHYVDWLVANPSAGTASGTISLPDGSTVTVDFQALFPGGSAGSFLQSQVMGGTNYWNPTGPYVSDEVENGPPSPDILRLQGGDNQIYKVTLSEPIKDPIMALVSLGQSSLPTTYNFDSPFTIVSQGTGYWGGNTTSLQQLPNNVLEGREGHGTIRFIGTFATFSWTVPTPEHWHGFTFGIRTTERLDPPDAGEADAAAHDAAAPDANVQDAASSDAPLADARGSDAAARDASGDAAQDAGIVLARGEDGCGCRVGGTRADGFSPWLGLVGLGLWARRRNRRSRR